MATAGLGLSLLLGGCGDDEDLPARTGDLEGTEIVPGEGEPLE